MSEIKYNASFSFELNNNDEIENQKMNPIFKLQSEDILNDIQKFIQKDQYDNIINYISNPQNQSKDQEPLLLQLDEKSHNGGNAIHYASINSNNNDFIELLIENGANVHSKTIEGYNVVHITSYYDNIPALRLYVEKYKVNINEKDCNGCTPLHLATYNNSIKSVAYLLCKGANINAQDNNKMTPLHSALSKYHKQKIKDKWKIPRLLYDHCASLTIKDNLNLTPLDYCKIKHFNFFTSNYQKRHSVHSLFTLVIFFFSLFFLIVVLPFVSSLFVLLPTISRNDHFYSYIILCIAIIIVFIIFLIFPSGYFQSKLNDQSFEALMNTTNNNVSEFCLFCLSKRLNHYHCLQCNKCIEDYYSTLFNKCIGKRNLLLFVGVMIVLSAFAFMNGWISLYCLCINEQDLNYESSVIPFMLKNHQWLYKKTTRMYVGGIILGESICLIFFSLYFLINIIQFTFKIKTQVFQKENHIITENEMAIHHD